MVEVILVIVIIGLLSSVAVSKFDTVFQYRQRGEIRKLINTWELLYQESQARGEAYRLLINIDDQTYTVRREVMQHHDGIRQVDHLKNLRTRTEKERRRQKELEQTANIEELLSNEASRDAQSLDVLFYQALFIDPYSDTNLEAPQEFPSLAQQNSIPKELRIRDVRTEAGIFQEGDAIIRFSPRGGSDFAVLHIEVNLEADQDEQQIITILFNPWTGKARVINREMDFEWTMDDNA
ncbi:MAG: hypothetical protein IT292_05515 [Deltaproteobacteria bacterium]|nr:hypothetical protein [Deltaproteobacteria bacterium]